MAPFVIYPLMTLFFINYITCQNSIESPPWLLVRWVIRMSAVSSVLTASAMTPASTEERLTPLMLSRFRRQSGALRAAKMAWVEIEATFLADFCLLKSHLKLVWS